MTSILTFSCMKKVNLIFPFSYLQDPDPGSGIKDGWIRIRDPGYQKMVGSGSGIWDKHPGSSTLLESYLFLAGAASIPSWSRQ
jgi:hypothetical protein